MSKNLLHVSEDLQGEERNLEILNKRVIFSESLSEKYTLNEIVTSNNPETRYFKIQEKF